MPNGFLHLPEDAYPHKPETNKAKDKAKPGSRKRSVKKKGTAKKKSPTRSNKEGRAA